jgi:surface antigen
MNTTWRLVAISLLLCGALTACEPQHQYRNIGALGGAATGGLIGAAACGDPVCVAAGAVAGLLAGGALGIQLDRQSTTLARQATYTAVAQRPVGTPVRWHHPQYPTQRYGVAQVTQEYPAQGTTCRDYTQVIVIDGREERGVGRACLAADGRWDVQ